MWLQSWWFPATRSVLMAWPAAAHRLWVRSHGLSLPEPRSQVIDLLCASALPSVKWRTTSLHRSLHPFCRTLEFSQKSDFSLVGCN